MSRSETMTTKVVTPFSPMYIHVEYDAKGYPIGGWISHPGKDDNSQISQLIEDLSKGLNEALKRMGEL